MIDAKAEIERWRRLQGRFCLVPTWTSISKNGVLCRVSQTREVPVYIGKTLFAQVMEFSCHGPASLASCNARWQLGHAHVVLRRTVSCHGIRSMDVAREPARHRSQQVMLNGHYSAKRYPRHMRRIRFKDPESGKTLIFLTNHMALPALTIAALYSSTRAYGRSSSSSNKWNGTHALCELRMNVEVRNQHHFENRPPRGRFPVELR